MQTLRSIRSLRHFQEMLKTVTELDIHMHHRHVSVVTPGKVSPTLSVPDHISRPLYVTQSFLQGMLPRIRRIERKTARQIQAMENSCCIARDILCAVGQVAREGVTTDEIDQFVHEEAIKHNCYPSPLMYKGFPKSVCTSVNNVACHGIPDNRPLEGGDIVNVDITVYHSGFHGDTSATFLIGDVDEDGKYLVDIARECRDAAIEICGPGMPLANIGNIISELAEFAKLKVIPEFCGHGIGESFHELPDIVHVSNSFKGTMEEGMTFTIEPVITEGDPSIHILSDGWTAISKDASRSAQFEHTILITADGFKILT